MHSTSRALDEEVGVIRFPCPCCGYAVLTEPTGSWSICPICRWEDDLTQLRWPTMSGGANRPSLVDAQNNYRALGVSDPSRAAYARAPHSNESTEAGWRPIDLSRDSFEAPNVQKAKWPDDRTVLYWWRPTFWRAPTNAQGQRDIG
jgi:hypothetical protein